MKKGEFDLSKIQPHPTNPRTISEQEVQFLERSLQAHPEFLKAHPIAYCSQTGYIFGGNQRYKALIKLGYTSVPQNWVQDISDWGEDAKIEFMFIDNKQSGEWDWDIINTEYEALELGDWGIVADELAVRGVTQDDDEIDVDYSLLDDEAINSAADGMKDGVKKAILIDFTLEDYPKAYELIGFFRERGADIGRMVMLYFESEKQKI